MADQTPDRTLPPAGPDRFIPPSRPPDGRFSALVGMITGIGATGGIGSLVVALVTGWLGWVLLDWADGLTHSDNAIALGPALLAALAGGTLAAVAILALGAGVVLLAMSLLMGGSLFARKPPPPKGT